MSKLSTIRTGIRILLNSFTGKRRPILVVWAIAGRCNLNCVYCQWSEKRIREISREHALSLVDQMAGAGTRHLVFSGGEPLLREDLGEIIERLCTKGIAVSIDSNGLLVPERADVIRQIDTLQLSLDGNRAPHDQLRGKGAFDGLIAAVDTAQTLGIKVSFNTTLTRNNLDQVPWILDFAGQNNAQADFQPISDVHAPQAQIAALLPDSDDFAKTIRLLKIRKSEGAPVANSQACLDFLANYPTPTQIPCSAGRLITRIDPAGMLFPCNQLREERSWPNAVELGFEKAFAKLPKVGCKNCWCSATVELNLIHSFNVGAIRNRFNAR